MMIPLENPRESTKVLIENNFSKDAGYKINPQKSTRFLYNKTQEVAVEGEIPF